LLGSARDAPDARKATRTQLPAATVKYPRVAVQPPQGKNCLRSMAKTGRLTDTVAGNAQCDHSGVQRPFGCCDLRWKDCDGQRAGFCGGWSGTATGRGPNQHAANQCGALAISNATGLWGRVPRQFRRGWKRHFAKLKGLWRHLLHSRRFRLFCLLDLLFRLRLLRSLLCRHVNDPGLLLVLVEQPLG